MSNSLRYTIGVDIGGTKIEAGLVDIHAQIVARRRCMTPVNAGPREVMEEAARLILELVSELRQPLLGVGIGVAGQVEPTSGVVRYAPNLKWEDVPLGTEVARLTQHRVTVTNDVRAITLGEWLCGAGRGCNDLVCVYVGTGIGGGVVSDGRIIEGAAHCAGEIGHMVVALDGPPCTCGNRGCWEALAGGWAIARRARDAAARDPGKARRLLELAGHEAALSAETVCQAEREQDPLASEILAEVSRALVAGCISLIHAFNPSRLIVGGGVIDGRARFIDEIRAGVMAGAMRPATQGLAVLPAALGKDAGVIGAALLARRVFSDMEVA